MSQFTVYRNPGKSSRAAYPYLLDIQHSVLEDLNTRVVIPLGKLANFKHDAMQTISPVIEFEGEQLVLLTPQIASVPARLLKEPVGSLAHFRSEIVAALDFAVSGF
ncbi:MAG: CcdB family protein [Thiolinea sp.]